VRISDAAALRWRQKQRRALRADVQLTCTGIRLPASPARRGPPLPQCRSHCRLSLSLAGPAVAVEVPHLPAPACPPRGLPRGSLARLPAETRTSPGGEHVSEGLLKASHPPACRRGGINADRLALHRPAPPLRSPASAVGAPLAPSHRDFTGS
jgi:hypothetical protein